jgi:hypothetical protein
MSKSENSEMDHTQLGNPSNEWISGSADHTRVLTFSFIPIDPLFLLPSLPPTLPTLH